jgi:hypothetical protein
MQLAVTALSWVLSNTLITTTTEAPNAAPSRRAEPPTIEVVDGPESTHVFARDAAGEVEAELVLWANGDPGQLEVAALFSDGLYLTATVSSAGEVLRIDSDDPTAVAERLNVLADVAAAGKWMCAAKLAIATFECASGNLVLCPAGAYFAACECGPHFFKNWDKEVVCDF